MQLNVPRNTNAHLEVISLLIRHGEEGLTSQETEEVRSISEC